MPFSLCDAPLTVPDELGVLYVPPTPLTTEHARSLVPWATPARPYGPDTVPVLGHSNPPPLPSTCVQSTPRSEHPLATRPESERKWDCVMQAGSFWHAQVPYSLDFIGSQLSGLGPLFVGSSKADVHSAIATSRRVAGPSPLPRMLTCTLGELHRLVQLRVETDAVTLLKRLPQPPESRSGHLSVRLDHISSGEFVDGQFVEFASRPRGVSILGSVAATFTVGLKAKPTANDPTMTFYSLADDERYVADCLTPFDDDMTQQMLQAQQRALTVATPTMDEDAARGGPPGGFLILLFGRDDALNARLLRDASQARVTIEERCWGLLVLQPSEGYESSWSAGLSTQSEPPPPSHSDLVALQYEIAALPALLLLSPNGKHEVLKLAGEHALAAHGLCQPSRVLDASAAAGPSRGAAGGGVADGGLDGGGVSLSALLMGADPAIASSRQKGARKHETLQQARRVPDFLAASTAQLVRSSPARRPADAPADAPILSLHDCTGSRVHMHAHTCTRSRSHACPHTRCGSRTLRCAQTGVFWYSTRRASSRGR